MVSCIPSNVTPPFPTQIRLSKSPCPRMLKLPSSSACRTHRVSSSATLRVGSAPVFKALSQLNGWNRRATELGRRPFFCSEPIESDSSAIVPTNAIPKDSSLTEQRVEKDDKSALSAKFRRRIEAKKDKIPARVSQVIEEELKKLQKSKKTSKKFKEISDYLDWLTVLPWGDHGDENFDIVRAQKILDEDHYGLNDVKEGILESIAVRRLRGTSGGKIICLSGPRGVRKTSIGRSIARALNRNFFLLSVGELKDVSAIKGKGRECEGATPGKMVQCLKSVGTEDPLVLIHKIDKLEGKGVQEALSELLDPERNANFRDLYLDVDLDLSKVLFVCTAKSTSDVPKPLRDKMEVIRIDGYIAEEKRHIARDHLEKTAREECGIKPEQVEVSDTALLSLIENYCREAGVKSLQMQLEKIYRKVALEIVQANELMTGPRSETARKVVIDESNLADYVGSSFYGEERIYEKAPVGVAMGLAWSSTGGSTQYIETAVVEKVKGKGKLSWTGWVGFVMMESMEIAHTVARRILLEKEPENTFFSDSKLHLHAPEGAVFKEGPSAGCTMVTSLLSLAMNKPVRRDLAMTGEITLNGRILSIGGVKEKVVGARRGKAKTVIFPAANKQDYEKLPESLKEGLEAHFVDDYDQIFELAFGPRDQTRAAIRFDWFAKTTSWNRWRVGAGARESC